VTKPTKKGETLLKGHALLWEGMAMKEMPTRRGGPIWTYSRDKKGPARCECGELSPSLPSTNQRQAWHRAHKESIRAQQGGMMV
jgi:hypothetical protein